MKNKIFLDEIHHQPEQICMRYRTNKNYISIIFMENISENFGFLGWVLCFKL